MRKMWSLFKSLLSVNVRVVVGLVGLMMTIANTCGLTIVIIKKINGCIYMIYDGFSFVHIAKKENDFSYKTIYKYPIESKCSKEYIENLLDKTINNLEFL